MQSIIGILTAASAPGSTVQRVVHISSAAAVMDSARLSNLPDAWTDKDWNVSAVAAVQQKGKDSSIIEKYNASKTLAERKAWELYEEGKAKGTIGWDLVTLIPPLVFGHYLGEVTPEKMNFSVGVWYRHVLQELPPVFPALDAYVDVSYSRMSCCLN